MTKPEIRTALETSGQINTFSATENWRKAFDMYNAEKRERLHPSCSMCFKKVKAWLLL